MSVRVTRVARSVGVLQVLTLRAGVLVLAVCSACQPPGLTLPGGGLEIRPPVWVTTFGGGADVVETAAPVVVGDRVLVNIAHAMVALDTGSGRILWQTPTGESNHSARLALSGPNVVAANGSVEAFNIVTGQRAWEFPVDASTSLSWNAADADVVVVGTSEHAVYAIDAATGQQRWRTDAMPTCQYRCITRGIALSGDTVYAAFDVFLTNGGGGSLGRVVAYARGDGHVLWSWDAALPAPQTNNIGAAPAVYRNLLLLPDTYGGSFFALDRFAVREVWRTGNQGLPGAAGPDTPFLVVGDTAFLASVDGSVYAIAPLTGRIYWRANTNSSIGEELALCGNLVMSSTGRMRSHDRYTGVTQRQYRPRTRVLSSGVGASATRAFVIGFSGTVNAFDC